MDTHYIKDAIIELNNKARVRDGNLQNFYVKLSTSTTKNCCNKKTFFCKPDGKHKISIEMKQKKKRKKANQVTKGKKKRKSKIAREKKSGQKNYKTGEKNGNSKL